MLQPKENISQPSLIFTATCAVLLVLITLFGLYGMKQIKKYDTQQTEIINYKQIPNKTP